MLAHVFNSSILNVKADSYLGIWSYTSLYSEARTDTGRNFVCEKERKRGREGWREGKREEGKEESKQAGKQAQKQAKAKFRS